MTARHGDGLAVLYLKSQVQRRIKVRVKDPMTLASAARTKRELSWRIGDEEHS